MNDQVAISVIMAAYNAEKTIRTAVDSILRQTFDDFELIIVDDASTDSTLSIMEEYAKASSKVRCVVRKKNGMAGGARNSGLELARGRYILFVDSDDWIDADMLCAYYDAVCEHKCDMVSALSYYVCYPDGRREPVKSCGVGGILTDAFIREVNDSEQLSTEAKNKLLFSAGGGWLSLFRAELLEKHSLRFPENLPYEDNYFVLLYMTHIHSCCLIDKPYYNYFQNSDSIVHRQDARQLKRLDIERLIYREMQQNPNAAVLHEGYEMRSILAYFNTIAIFYNKLFDDSVTYIKAWNKEFHKMFPHYWKNRYYAYVGTGFKIRLFLWTICPAFYKRLIGLKKRLKGA